MAKKKISLRPAVEAIDALLKELDSAEAPADEKDRKRNKALRASLEGTSMLLQASCWSASADTVYEFPS
jgi:hypothetical protein